MAHNRTSVIHDPFDAAPVHLHALLAVIFLIITVGAAVDLVLDDHQTVWSVHFFFEAALVVFSLGAFAYLASGWFRAIGEVHELRSAVATGEAERDAWRARAGELLTGLSHAVHDQFDAWELTPAERETALMLLKGHSHKRIGRLTDRSEGTVRQHAVAVYRKAGLAGRSELSAFFLEDLLLPDADGAPALGGPSSPAR